MRGWPALDIMRAEAAGPSRTKNKGALRRNGESMSKELFKDAIEAAREIEQITRPNEESEGVRRLSEKAISRVQELVEKAQAAMTEAAVAGDFGSAQEARQALRGLPQADYDALRAFAERNMPVNETTRFLAEAIAPGRSATIAAFKTSPFGSAFQPKPEPKAKGEPAAREADLEGEELQGSLKLVESEEKKASRAEAARAAEEKTLREQNQSFQSLARAFGKGLPASKAGQPSIAAAPGVRVVEGEKQVADPVAQLPAEARAKREAAAARAAKAAAGGKKLTAKEAFELAQMGLFDEGAAPVPADAEQKRGRGRPRKNKAM